MTFVVCPCLIRFLPKGHLFLISFWQIGMWEDHLTGMGRAGSYGPGGLSGMTCRMAAIWPGLAWYTTSCSTSRMGPTRDISTWDRGPSSKLASLAAAASTLAACASSPGGLLAVGPTRSLHLHPLFTSQQCPAMLHHHHGMHAASASG